MRGFRRVGLVNRVRVLPAEIRRRGVDRVAIAYAVTAGVIAQVSAAAFPALAIPPWVLSLEILLLVLGFPLVVVGAWTFGAPLGMEGRGRGRRSGIARLEARPVARRRAGLAEGPGGVSGAGTGWTSDSEGAPASGGPRDAPAIAALPFVDRSHLGGHQFLGDGIADELIDVLAGMSGLRVVARTSSFRFRDEVVDIREIARLLGVDFILEGSVRVGGDRLRTTARLIEAEAGTAVWSGSCERPMDDLLTVQEGLAREVVSALCRELDQPFCGPSAWTEDLGRGTDDPQAYTLYLRGRSRWEERTPTSLRQAISYFERAIALDPGFARAHAGLADAHAILTDHGLVSPQEGIPRARLAAAEAMRLAPRLAESRMSAALVRQLDGDFRGAEGEFRRAIAANPALAGARQRLALLLAWTGRPDEARETIREAVAIDPLSPAVAVSEGWVEYYAGEHERALRVLSRVVEEHPALESARCGLGLVRLARGEPDAAVRALEGVPEGGPPSVSRTALLSHALARAGRVEDAAATAAPLLRDGLDPPLPSYYTAVIRLGFEEREGALAALENLVEESAPERAYLAADPIFASLRGNPRFERVLEASGLTPEPVPVGAPRSPPGVA